VPRRHFSATSDWAANELLQQTAAAMLVSRSFEALGAAAAAELDRSLT
jgi:hypothetical protein